MSRLTFFQNSADNNIVDKTNYLTHLGYSDDNIVKADIVDDCSIKTPVFLLGSFPFDFSHCNYLYCSDFGRYYYINDVVVKNNGMTELPCSVDVLMTYASGIRDLYTIVERQEQVDNCNPYIVDDLVIGRVDRQIEKKSLPNSVGGNATGNHIVLTVTGGE